MPRFLPLLRSALLLGSAFAANAFAAQLTPTGYGYNSSPSSSYADSSGAELTDGITYSRAWDGVSSIGPADIVNLVGWQTSPTITFTFAAPVTIRSVSIFFADSNGAAGVAMPSDVFFGDGDGFFQSFSVTDPDGAGSTVESVFSGFSVSATSFSITVLRSTEWVMLSEVQFFDTAPVPEPASCARVAGTAALGFLACRRRRRA